MIILNGDLDKFWTFYINNWSEINFSSVIQNGTFFLKFFIHPQSESLIQKMCIQESIKLESFLREGD